MKNEMPKIPNSNHKLLKKGTKLVLSAATFGVVAAGEVFKVSTMWLITIINKIQHFKVQML